MKSLCSFTIKTFVLVTVFILFTASGSALGAGFALIEQGVSGLGNAYAGGAASDEDATTVFFNPDGLTRLDGQQFI
ncbi:MAG: long chain fatty acid transport protein, partial [Nitrospira sp.]|nr:long chain fatty acid transport protein [Nitrospira sp.]